jgi:hypothetical protein
MILLTQSYRESGLTDLIPIGIIRHEKYYYKGMEDLLKELKKDYGKKYDYIFNVRMEFSYLGHPGNNDYKVILTGDGYKKHNSNFDCLKEL